ncbi:MAG: transposase, partial [Dehalococcoidia bacterium]
MTDCRFCWFGDVVNETVELNILGKAVLAEWLRGPEVRPGVELGEFVIMPNHLHGIVTMPGESRGGA